MAQQRIGVYTWHDRYFIWSHTQFEYWRRICRKFGWTVPRKRRRQHGG